ncbi:precorrin-3B synthase [Trinickia caryophylli]|uniref:precorrin-3B synthase n=1 Tax=Trinickia caryophylli TaxID=28094 RepID=UPI000A16053E|nr:precorrin-3B synthase [Trinickia caryophylli]PMS09938.1 precorrin-3B synthase [Trinickia caryophylli]TRX14912.1 precorrin-3B synthase [Trinickia caryophylli]WQE14762.1 precorrin-3B synthase [Trinickia caryophylli]GLU34961.1 precorrin-3B synthase [Trinickia caryophylli]
MNQDPSFIVRPSACPALARIVAARDGGLCRIKLPGGELSAAQAVAVADAARAHASGVIELTNRANLQLRGVRPGQERALVARLLDAGLGPLRPDGTSTAGAHAGPDERGPEGGEGQEGLGARLAAADDVRNVMTSPTAGRDEASIVDTRPLAAELLALLQSEPRFASLSPKFAVLLDGGERLAAVDHPHDVWLCAMPPDAGEPLYAFGLAGQPSTPADYALGAVSHANAAAFVRALLHTFLDLAGPDETRMRHVLNRHGLDAVLHRLALRFDGPLRRGVDISAWRRDRADASLRFGTHRQKQAGRWYVGGQPPLGRIDSSTLHALAQLASVHGNGTLRITPWQGVLLPDIAEQAVPPLETGLDTLGFIRDAGHPLARLIACAGSSGCAKSLADTKADALSLARSLPASVHVHLTGCIRSCAAAHCAPYTLLAVAPGRYDLHRREDASPAAPHRGGADCAHRFGTRIASHLTIDEAADRLRAADQPHPNHA